MTRTHIDYCHAIAAGKHCSVILETVTLKFEYASSLEILCDDKKAMQVLLDCPFDIALVLGVIVYYSDIYLKYLLKPATL